MCGVLAVSTMVYYINVQDLNTYFFVYFSSSRSSFFCAPSSIFDDSAKRLRQMVQQNMNVFFVAGSFMSHHANTVCFVRDLGWVS